MITLLNIPGQNVLKGFQNESHVKIVFAASVFYVFDFTPIEDEGR